ncbi:hypothetical protein DYE50_04930 [Treponema ruminis]|uniref:Type I restriction enzyme S subunit n=1 Tax=Treponema ruminis TaxID=744515 RepID=A0A7W8G7G5_9SPIR|nr:restriction endonuclease subunit S [Treponema ruminis]MBB5225210.1 type I restriction enzyme S subunit [Treponema ruminis]QSI01919.1 hypothetical protein DYE50_04930 [Treponema ruminis]
MSEWKKVKIGDICKIVKGTTGIASAEPGEYTLVVTAEERKTCSTYQFDCEAVCIPLVSSSGHGKKSLKNVHYQSGKFALGTILCAVIPNNPQELDARYLHQYLQFYKDIILVPLMKGAANVSLSMKDIATVEFPLPPIERQRELSNLFVSLQEKQKELSAEYEKQTDYAKLLRQNILQQAIEGKLTANWRKQNPVKKGNPNYDAEALFEQIQKGEVSPSLQPASQFSATPSAGSNVARNTRSKSLAPITYEEKPFKIPNSWKDTSLGYLISISSGDNLTEKEKREGNIPVYGGNGINGNHNISNINKISIIIGRVGAQCGCIHITPEKAWVTDNAFVTSFNESMINFYWLYYLLNSLSLRNYARETAQPVLSGKRIYPLIIGLPPLKEQEEIVNKVEILLAKVTTLEKQIQDQKLLTKTLMQTIIKEAFEV